MQVILTKLAIILLLLQDISNPIEPLLFMKNIVTLALI